MFLLAWFAPNLPRALLTDEEKQVAAAHHAVAIGREDMAYATLFATARRPVNDRPISLRQLNEHFALRDRATFSDALAVRRADAQERLVRRLVKIAPTEAAVERVFSALKLNVGRLRTRCKPDAAVAQVLLKTTTTFLAEASKQLLLEPEDCVTVRPQTMLNIVRLGAAKLRVLKPLQAAAIDDNCAVCRTKRPRMCARNFTERCSASGCGVIAANFGTEPSALVCRWPNFRLSRTGPATLCAILLVHTLACWQGVIRKHPPRSPSLPRSVPGRPPATLIFPFRFYVPI
jgi:hypothetical protein